MKRLSNQALLGLLAWVAAMLILALASSLESEVDKGTAFTIHLPVSGAPQINPATTDTEARS
jgi:predicted component of type VI protein secretion system